MLLDKLTLSAHYYNIRLTHWISGAWGGSLIYAGRWYHHVSNCEVRRLTEQPPLTTIIQKRRLTLFGHLVRMDESADARRILTAVPRVSGEGQLGDPTPPGWPLWRTT